MCRGDRGIRRVFRFASPLSLHFALDMFLPSPIHPIALAVVRSRVVQRR